MQTVFVYQADLLCRDCGGDIVQTLVAECIDDDGDSCHFPQMELISESDTPDHCAGCGCFLDNPLTLDGMAYVQQWARRYGFHNARVLND